MNAAFKLTQKLELGSVNVVKPLYVLDANQRTGIC